MTPNRQANDILGPYTLVREIGSGAFGVVWLAATTDAPEGPPLTLKLLRDNDLEPDALRQYAGLWRDVSDHPNLFRVEAVEMIDGQVVLASEYVPDGSLEGWLKQRRDPEAAPALLSGVLAGLEQLHSHGIVHGNLTPSNILLQAGTPRLTDFGLPAVFRAGMLSRMPAYLAPETFEGRRTELSDLWSAGMLLYQLLGGSYPLPPADALLPETILAGLPASAPAYLVEVVVRSLEADPGKRFASAAEMRQAVECTGGKRADRTARYRMQSKGQAESSERGGEKRRAVAQWGSAAVLATLMVFFVVSWVVRWKGMERTIAPGPGGDGLPLMEAVAHAPRGAVLHLKPGAYLLRSPLIISRSLSLIGDDPKRTQIVCNRFGAVVLLTGGGTWQLQGIAFQHNGTAGGDVLKVDSGEIEISDCSFTGGYRDRLGQTGGDGIYLLGDTGGTIEDCNCTRNGLNGIGIAGRAHPDLGRDHCQENRYAGIAYYEGAAGRAIRNECTQNGRTGIAVEGVAHPSLNMNRSWENAGSGMAYFDDTSGTAEGDDCTYNSTDGIELHNRSHPVLGGDRCWYNKGSGIVYFDYSSAASTADDCSQNGKDGIAVQGSAHVIVSANRCRLNRFCGIAFFETAAGTLQGNECSSNGLDGLAMFGSSFPVVDGTVCHENYSAGIFYGDSAVGVCTGDNCYNNGTDGIVVSGHAHPRIEGNECRQNHEDGILYQGDSAGESRFNDCQDNRLDGIELEDRAQPDLRGNRCQQNHRQDVHRATLAAR